MVIVHISKYEYTQKVWRAREKRYSRGKGLLLGGYNTGILMDPDDLVFFFTELAWPSVRSILLVGTVVRIVNGQSTIVR